MVLRNNQFIISLFSCLLVTLSKQRKKNPIECVKGKGKLASKQWQTLLRPLHCVPGGLRPWCHWLSPGWVALSSVVSPSTLVLQSQRAAAAFHWGWLCSLPLASGMAGVVCPLGIAEEMNPTWPTPPPFLAHLGMKVALASACSRFGLLSGQEMRRVSLLCIRGSVPALEGSPAAAAQWGPDCLGPLLGDPLERTSEKSLDCSQGPMPPPLQPTVQCRCGVKPLQWDLIPPSDKKTEPFNRWLFLLSPSYMLC